tara:strand:+ start:427 stop:681 length:255 start_codon:yes stop_codon:yes gene_type:complete
LIFSFNISNNFPDVGCFLIKTLINEGLIESKTDSSREHRNETPRARKKYRNSADIYIEFRLWWNQTAMSFDGNIVAKECKSIPS